MLIDSMEQSTYGGTDDACQLSGLLWAFYGIPGFITVFSVSNSGPIADILHRRHTYLHLSSLYFLLSIPTSPDIFPWILRVK